MKEIDIMEPEFPESIDLKITNYCENNCKYCYANSNKEGKHANKNFIKDIISEIKKNNYEIIKDRKKAIIRGISYLKNK